MATKKIRTPQPGKRAGIAPHLSADDIAAIAWLAEDMNRRQEAGEFRDLEARSLVDLKPWTFRDALHATFRRGVDVIARDKRTAELQADPATAFLFELGASMELEDDPDFDIGFQILIRRRIIGFVGRSAPGQPWQVFVEAGARDERKGTRVGSDPDKITAVALAVREFQRLDAEEREAMRVAIAETEAREAAQIDPLTL